MMRIHHPLPSLDFEVSPTARFGGYAPASTPSGVVVADDQTYRFMAVLDGFPHNRWHRDIDWTAGIPSVDRGVIYTGVGGPGATRGIMALNSATGEPLWSFAPHGLKADPERIESVKVPRTLNVPVTRMRAMGRNDGGAVQGGSGARMEREIIGSKTVQVPVIVPQPNSLLPHGHWTSAGIVVADGRIYGEVERQVVCLDQRTGSLIWSYPLGENGMVHSLVATPQHLLFCMSTIQKGHRLSPWEVRGEKLTDDALVALRLDNGKPVWKEEVAYPGTLALSGGLVYFANGDLHVLGPPERTYHLAANSDRAEDYRPEPSEPNEPGAPVAASCDPAPAPAPAAPRQVNRGDASALRLTYGTPAAELVSRARARRSVVGVAPLLITLEWPKAQANWNAAQIREFAAVATQVASAAQPDYLDLAPEVNRYLLRNPAELEAVRSLIQTAAGAIHQQAPHTKVVVSVDTELLAGLYGGARTPGTNPSSGKSPEPSEWVSLLSAVDVVGLSTEPQNGFRLPEQVPPDYLVVIRNALGRKPVLVTRLAVRITGKSPREVAAEAGFLERIRLACYWLNAELVARPEISFREPEGWPRDAALSPAELVELAASGWNMLPRWKRVSQLSIAPPVDPANRAPGYGPVGLR